MNIKAGLYRHFKGELYLVYGQGIQTENNEELVVYKKFSSTLETTNSNNFFLRPVSNFNELITIEDENHPRFSLLSEEETKEALKEHFLNKSCPQCNESECSCN